MSSGNSSGEYSVSASWMTTRSPVTSLNPSRSAEPDRYCPPQHAADASPNEETMPGSSTKRVTLLADLQYLRLGPRTRGPINTQLEGRS